jgi:hypothetical protein
MNRIFLIGDVHLSLGFPNKSDKWFKVHQEYFDKFLFPYLESEVEEGDIIVQLGDLYDNRDIIPIDHLNYGLNIVERLAKLAPTHILVGNHDMYNKSSGDINTIKPFKYIPNVFIYDTVQEIEFNGKTILMMPYIEKKNEQIKYLKKHSGCDYLFCHSDLNGARMHLTSVAHRNNHKLDPTEFKGYGIVKTGHIHIRQNIKNISFVGSIFQMDRNDFGDKKGIEILDTETDKTIFIENTVSPVFKKVNVLIDEDIDLLDELKDSNDYIDIKISNDLLINKRKLRRKLELILEQGNFSSIEYINDIEEVKESKEEEETKEEDLDIDISIELDYEEYIKEYIKNKDYKSKFKKGILSEYDEIIEVYKKEYKPEN